jgi:hypothetical protein
MSNNNFINNIYDFNNKENTKYVNKQINKFNKIYK